MAVENSVLSVEQSEVSNIARDYATEIREMLYPMPDNIVKTNIRWVTLVTLGAVTTGLPVYWALQR